MKSSIDNRCPRKATNLRSNAKKNYLIEERIDQIETENRHLLEKMSNIMRVSLISNSFQSPKEAVQNPSLIQTHLYII